MKIDNKIIMNVFIGIFLNKTNIVEVMIQITAIAVENLNNFDLVMSTRFHLKYIIFY